MYKSKQTESVSAERSPMFSLEIIRLLIGFIALVLSVVVLVASSFAHLTSISASYHTSARDIFVGLLFVLGAFMFAYKGKSVAENWVAYLGALAAWAAALFPTACDSCQSSFISMLHLAAGATLFLVTAYFCLGPFRLAAAKKTGTGAARRVKFYVACGGIIVACLVFLMFAEIVLADIKKTYALTFWGETIMLWAFGAAWIVACKGFPGLDTDKTLKGLLKELIG